MNVSTKLESMLNGDGKTRNIRHNGGLFAGR
jgi:hypothetical protein